MGCAASKPQGVVEGGGIAKISPSKTTVKEQQLNEHERFYKPLDVLEETPEGFVKVALDTRTQQHVEIRYLRRGDTIDKYVENELVNRRVCFVHPHIIQFREVFVTPEYLAIVQEHVSGGTMKDYSRRSGPLPESAARWFFQQLMVGVDFTHRQGIASRDLKLESIVLDLKGPKPILKIYTLGASINENEQKARSVVGTPEYVAPEVLTAPFAYDAKKADVWACGVILYFLLTGQFPFNSNDSHNPHSIIKKILAADYVPPAHVSDLCRDLLAHLLVANPANRYSTSEVLKHPWFLKNLPERALIMNEQLLQKPLVSYQSEEEIRRIVSLASKPGPSQKNNYYY